MRPGRKRKQRGHLVERQRPDPARVLAAEQPHRAWLPADKRLSEKAATPLGGLNLIGVLTDEQYEAGCRYVVVVAAYRASIGCPMEGYTTRKSYRCLGERGCEDCECRRRKDAYDRAFTAVSDAGQRSARCVARVAVYGEACPAGQIADLRRGLDALAVHFGAERLTRKAKSEYAGNMS